ncbi:hypothetical protein RDI58_003139 [Solanum bulbocastanum]|uniref:Uncharacterized protein n=1 Tax=Solanum bulbocastanum TaxID=147425 RepID=A0AAN8U7W9_SOLBU
MHLSGDDPAEPKLSRQAEEPSCPETSLPTSSFWSSRAKRCSFISEDHPILSCTASCWPDLSPPPATWYEIPLPPFFLPFSVFFFCCTATTGQQESSDPIQMTDDRPTKGVYRSSLGFGKSFHSFFYPHQLLDNLLRSWQSFYCLMDSVMDVSFSSPVQSLLLRCSSGTYFFYLTMLAHLSIAIDRNSCI